MRERVTELERRDALRVDLTVRGWRGWVWYVWYVLGRGLLVWERGPGCKQCWVELCKAYR